MTATTIATLRPPGSKGAGVALFFCALVAFASYDAFCKQMLQYYPAPFINLMRYVSVICIAFAMLLHHGDLRIWRAPQKKLLVLRGMMLGTVATCFMTALIWMPLAVRMVSGSRSTGTTVSVASTTARSTTFSSSRTLPCQW